ncbi:PTS sugar transporter subunit IIB [Desulfovibrio ferrophilus]|uniref:PTS system sorbose subfamily IIB component n=1 Tax=Desulfovibrio ferrophilus TaxID=241368 RepID=A0A2Z6AWH3_9BACT|nr:PTS sugar transporter subunit IIB [Desulfovibrio ferrophilus]BBD07578.1 PTS system sorbose subfamily IIB component [Desulfovibrio ferrophilus]
MFWVRVDNRLIHGQIIETWLPYTKSRTIIVANDEVCGDPLRQEIMGLAIPSHIDKIFVCVEDTHEYMSRAYAVEEPDVLVLFSSCVDARRAHQKGLAFKSLNLGNMHYGPGKEQVCAHVALDGHDRSCLQYFDDNDVDLDFRCVPNQPIQVSRSW